MIVLNIKPAIKWSGSKRSQSIAILNNVPHFNRYFEPFVGSASIAYAISPRQGICGDICQPLISLWRAIQTNCEEIAEQYKIRWEKLQYLGHTVFYEIRDTFNRNHDPADFLFLSRTCVNGLIRFNKSGEFNNSLHHTRRGIEPERLKAVLRNWSSRLQGVDFRNGDYWETTEDIKEGDFVYLDPPYLNTKGRYYGTIDYDRFLRYLHWLNQRRVKYALSLDGKRGNRDYSIEVPQELYTRHLMLPSGNSSFKKVMNKKCEPVLESLYLNY
ncbi:MAG: Dam family site-specific DNA-(adenine-N6)-methyltransferase [Holophagales bacterium]|jgi:DNA adenine methylase|nr:Dam family site-specific DNA-(adenine-N6)-methyltransferase [Holophagales bacterium]